VNPLPGQVAALNVDRRRTMEAEITSRAGFIKRNANATKPFYAYVSFSLFHFPTLPNPEFVGKTGNGDWADCLAEMDYRTGQILDAIKEAGIEENTIVMFASDNGPEATHPWEGDSEPWRGRISRRWKPHYGRRSFIRMESFVPAPTLDFPGLKAMLEKYQAKAPSLGIDPLGYGFTPFAYAAGQLVAQAVEATKSLDHDKLAHYIRSHKFSTVAGEIAFGKDGEWTKSRQFFTQFQGVSGNDLAQFRDTAHQVILWPPEYKTGNIIYPYQARRRSKTGWVGAKMRDADPIRRIADEIALMLRGRASRRSR